MPILANKKVLLKKQIFSILFLNKKPAITILNGFRVDSLIFWDLISIFYIKKLSLSINA